MTGAHCSLAAALVAVIVLGCGDVAGTDLTLADFAGTWNASQMLWTERQGNPRRSFDFIQNGGAINITFAPNGSVSGSGSSLFTGDFTLTGSVALDGGLLRADLEARAGSLSGPALSLPDEFAFTLAGGTLTLSNLQTLFDFGFDGSEEDASFVIVLRRR